MKYLVTSATGDLAGKAVDYLKELVSKEDIIVTSRSLERAQALEDEGFEVRQADYFDRESLFKAFDGVDRILLVSSGDLDNREQQHKNVVDAAQESRVSFIAYTSAPKIKESNAGVAPDHIATEKYIEESGLNYAFLRNNWYLENEAMFIQGAKKGQPIVYSAGDGKVGWAVKEDYAEAGARVLAEVAPKQRIYELGGEPITYKELSDKINSVIDNPVKVHQVTDQEFEDHLIKLDMSQEAAQALVGIQQDIRNGELDVSSEDLETVLNRKRTPLEEKIKKI